MRLRIVTTALQLFSDRLMGSTVFRALLTAAVIALASLLTPIYVTSSLRLL